MNNSYYREIPNNPLYHNNNNIINNNYNNINNLENLLNINKGKKITIYQNYNNTDKSFKGIIEKVENAYTIISDPTTGKWYLLLNKYTKYIEFDEAITINGQFY